MKTILTHQKANKDGYDVLVIDGVVSNYNGNDEQRSAMKILNSTEKKKDYSILKILSQGCSQSLKIEIGVETGGAWVSSHFLSKDEWGRNIPYSFWMNSFNDSTEIINKLEECAKLSKMQLNPMDIKAIARCIDNYSKVKYAVYAVGIVLVLIVLIIIF